MPHRSEYSPFGLDAHACIGEALTRMFATVVARELSVGCRLEPTADGPAIFTEHYHWAPSPGLSGALQSRGPDGDFVDVHSERCTFGAVSQVSCERCGG